MMADRERKHGQEDGRRNFQTFLDEEWVKAKGPPGGASARLHHTALLKIFKMIFKNQICTFIPLQFLHSGARSGEKRPWSLDHATDTAFLQALTRIQPL